MTCLQKYLDTTPEQNQSKGAIAYLAALDHISETAPDIADAIKKELQDQRSHLKLIASENYSSLAVQLAMGNLLTDKYSEGYPHHRFYAGCENVDVVEDAAVQELKSLFGCDHAYVQPHSGADANLVAFWAILTQKIQNSEIEKLGKKNLDALTPEEYERVRQLLVNQKVMGMSLNAGGHLTHGYRHNISSKMMQAFHYDVDPKTGILDYAQIRKQAKEVKPTILLAGYSAYPRLVNFAKMREIADEVGAVFMVDMAHFSGLVAGKALTGENNPVPFAHVVSSTTHKTLRGPRGGLILCTEEFAESVNKGCPLVLGGPLPHVIAAKAIAFREANTPSFQTYAKNVIQNCNALAEALLKEGIPLVTGGTDNHLLILDLTTLGITGRQAELALLAGRVTANRNAIPFDQNGPWYTSGVRIGTAAMTTLGMGVAEMAEIASVIASILKKAKPAIVERTGLPSKAKFLINENILESAQKRVEDLLGRFPLYPEISIVKNEMEKS